MKGILGRKIGMTQVFTTDGLLIPVTVVEADANVVLQKKTVATDGYDAVSYTHLATPREGRRFSDCKLLL